MAASRLYLEPYGQLALDRLMAVIGEAKAGDALAPVTVVVPTAYAGLSIRRRLAASGGLVNVRFMMLPWLAEYIASGALARAGKTRLSPLLEMATIRGLAQQVADGPLAPVAHHPRLHLSLRRTFADLSQLTDDELPCLAAHDELRRQLVGVYRLYRQRLSSCFDDEGLMKAAATTVAAGTSGTMRDLGCVVFYLTNGLAPSEIDLVRVLGRAKRAVAIFGLTGDAEVDDVTRQRILPLEAELGAAQSRDDDHRPSQTAHIVSACDAHEEVRWVLRDIVRRAREGLPLRRVAVLYRQPEPYGFLLSGELAMAGIPAAGPDTTSLSDTPSGRLLGLLLEIAESDMSRETVMRWLSETPVRIAASPDFSTRDLARWDSMARSAGVVRGLDSWKERLAHYGHKLERELQELEDGGGSQSRIGGTRWQITSSAQLGSFVEKLARDLTPPDEASWQRCGKWMRSLLTEYLRDGVDEQLGPGYHKIVALIDELTQLPDSALKADAPTLRALLQAGMEAPAGKTGSSGTGVFVAPVAAAQGMHFDVVYLVGMSEGAFPPAHGDDPLLPDRLRASLVGGERVPPRRARQVEERRAYLAALAAGRQRVLLYSRADSAASRPQYPSHWLLDEASVLAGRRMDSDEITRLAGQSWLSVIQSAEHAISFAETTGAADLQEYNLASLARWLAAGRPAWAHFLAATGGALDRAFRAEQKRWSNSFTEWDGRVCAMAGKSRRLGVPDQPISPTRLERWAKCPYLYFLGDVLGISALERPEELFTISPRDRGSLVHGILERFMTEVIEQGMLPPIGEPWQARHRERLLAIADEQCDEQEKAGNTGSRLAWEAARAEIQQDLSAFLDADSRWRAERRAQPVWIEQRFGFAGGLPAPEITLADGRRLRFRGVIDRVDQAPNGDASVMDYKTGASNDYKDIKPDDPTAGGKRLQLPVYALAVQGALADVTRVDACYWFISERGRFERKTITLADSEGPLRRAAQTITAGILDGVFPAVPGKRQNRYFQNCRYCDFDRVCPASRAQLLEMKRSDERLAAVFDVLGDATSGEGEDDG